MLKDGIEAQFDEGTPEEPTGRVARRKAGFATAIGEATHWHDRIAQRDILLT